MNRFTASSIGLAAAIVFAPSSAPAVTHTSVFTTVELSLKQPLDERSHILLVSIAADGLVTIRFGDRTEYTARQGQEFLDAHGQRLSTHYELVAVSPAKDAVTIRYETRVYMHPTPTPPKPKHTRAA